MRIDKWLWVARFFKTRALAVKACELGRIEWNGQAAKPAREVKVGDKLRIRKDNDQFQIEVLSLALMRGSASVAQTMYAESEESKAARLAAVEARKSAATFDFDYEGRPSKKDRRQIARLRGRLHSFNE